MMTWVMRTALVVMLLGPARPAAAGDYRTQGACGGFPRVGLQASPGLCVGLVAEHLGAARGVAVLGDAIYVLDMGGWQTGRGRLLRLGHDGHDAPEVLLSGLDEPNGLTVTPEGSLYAGLLGRVVRVVLSGPVPVLKDVLTGLPTAGSHPLSSVAAAPDGSLYVNVGSATDHCEGPGGTPPDPGVACPERAATPPRASLVRVVPGPGGIAWPKAEAVAFGLRNSMGLAVMPGGALVATVNARDAIGDADPALSDELLPHDTLDVIAQGADYGWPYCFDDNRASPEYAHHDCSAMHRPSLLLPPHGAPLGLLRYRGDVLPGLKGRLVIAFHGYRAQGHRLMGLAVGADGRPSGAPSPLVWGWDRTERNPQGAPVGLAEMGDGSVLVTEDQNGTLLRLARP